jgi:hypothetical protein
LLALSGVLFGVDAMDNGYLPPGFLERASKSEIQATVPDARKTVEQSKRSASRSTLTPWFLGEAGGVTYGLEF